MSTSTTDHPQDYGVVVVENGLVTALEEKSKHPQSNQINAGAYFSLRIFLTTLTGFRLPAGENLNLLMLFYSISAKRS